MEPMVAERGRALTITRARKLRLRRDAVLMALLNPPGRRWLTVGAVGAGALGFAVGGVPGAAVLVIVSVLDQVGWWWLRMGTSMRSGLDTGQTIHVDYAATGELRLTDATDQLSFGPGTARVIPFRSTVTVVTEELAFILPVELLGEDDVAYLEGRTVSPGEGSLAGPRLPFECRITPDLQRDLVSAVTRVIVRSADFLVVWLWALLPVLLAAFTSRPTTVAIIAAAMFALLALPSLLALRRTRATVREAYPVGTTVQAAVTDTRLLLGVPRGTIVLDLQAYRRKRVVGQALVLTLHGRPFRVDQMHVVPAALFDDDALATLGVSQAR